jgi:catechol 2,3-dioxygenase-like lactoylglutathione lyase family enzyme
VITNISVVSIPVSDQDRAKDFYVNTLGFDLLVENEMMPGSRWIQVAPKGAQTSLTLVNWFEHMPAGSVDGLVIATDDIESAYSALVAKGVTFDGPPQDQMGGIMTTFHDPDGNGLVLWQRSANTPENL